MKLEERTFGTPCISIFVKNCSGWYFKEVLSLELHTVQYKLMKGSSFILLPDFIVKKKAIIHLKKNNQKCFLWSILRYLIIHSKYFPDSDWLEAHA